jgi:hypothetical protein
MKNLLRYGLIGLLSPLFATYYALFVIFKGARKYPGSFPRRHRWYVLQLPVGSARCSDGSPYRIYLKRGATNKLLVFFSGGGVSWNEYTAARPMTVLRMLSGKDSYYIPGAPAYLQLLNRGILAAQDAKNPFNDWNVVVLPYSSADFHVGNHEFPYTDLHRRSRLLYHWGAHNVNAALEAARSAFGTPDQLLIAGESAGAFGCVAAAPDVARHFPDCQKIAVYSDSAQLFCPQWEAIVRNVWKADPGLADCMHSGGNLILDWFEWLYQQMGDEVVYLQYCSLYDATLSIYQNKMNHDTFALDSRALAEFHRHLVETLQTLSGKIPSYRYFVSDLDKNQKDGSTDHTVSRGGKFYRTTAQGLSVATWLSDAVNGDRATGVSQRYHVGEELLIGER